MPPENQSTDTTADTAEGSAQNEANNTSTSVGTTEGKETSAETSSRKETDWKAEARKWEDRAKANKDAADRLKTLEDANKSELQLAQEALSTETARGDSAENELRRYKAAVKFGLSDEDIDLLGDGTDEEVEARAQRLAELAGDKSGPRRPTPNPAQGNQSNTQSTPASAFASVWESLS